MEWTDIVLTLPKKNADEGIAVLTGVFEGGLHIEDYSDLEEQVEAIAHVDLIEEDLLHMPKDTVQVHLYVSPDDNAAQLVEKLQSALLAAGLNCELAIRAVQQEDWENAWKQYYHSMEVGARLAVVPSWEEYRGERIQLVLDPGMAFGTGTHETTYLCLELLDERIQGGARVLDIGTGSGILSIAALLLGAQSALGIDIDALAVRTAQENARLNDVQNRFTAVSGNLAGRADGTYDVVVANIVAAAIESLAPEIPALLNKDAVFIASGIIEEKLAGVEKALCDAGLVIAEKREKKGWVALVARLPG